MYVQHVEGAQIAREATTVTTLNDPLDLKEGLYNVSTRWQKQVRREDYLEVIDLPRDHRK
jgi:hypothetical protein